MLFRSAVTVYYDPKDPSNCVLERELPKGFGKGCAVLVAIAAVIGGIIWYLVLNGPRLVDTYLPNVPGFSIALFCFGLAVLLFSFVSRRVSKQAQSWPVVSGTVVSSSVESYEKYEDGRRTTYYQPAVEFSYQVHGVEYRSRQIKLGVTVSGSKGGAEKTAARYPEGGKVDVHYDPANPNNAALENPTGAAWLLLAIALAMMGFALYTSGLIK